MYIELLIKIQKVAVKNLFSSNAKQKRWELGI